MQDTDPTTAASADHLAHWLRLEQASGVGCRSANLLLQHFGSPAAIFAAGVTALSQHVTQRQARALCAPPSAQFDALLAATQAWLAEPAHHIITQHDPRYPNALANIADPPLMLYVNGNPGLLARPALAIVGSRNASTQGKANAEGFARALSQAGVTIVSGLALGIDAAAHAGALKGEGATIAVIGTGADRVYPAANRALARDIAEQGCIVSEYALGTPATSGNFPRRNRIISGLSAGVLVVEAAAESGSLITAHVAADQGREVFALPGSIHSALSKGCHKLIREGARLVETVDEVLEALQLSPLAGRRPRAQQACGGLLDHVGFDPIGFDALAAATGAKASTLNSELLLLELAGLIERLPGGAVQRLVR
ncbi:DNA-processing protein DprA [Massilia agilis]|uniref:DNA-processing protein DprA n=1 Tax=Massilia agilis TaxID=1811226 RepID=A0ABT2DK16_9BURK|nr:DNA-processing protein DprA [Massilia agilis]